MGHSIVWTAIWGKTTESIWNVEIEKDRTYASGELERVDEGRQLLEIIKKRKKKKKLAKKKLSGDKWM